MTGRPSRTILSALILALFAATGIATSSTSPAAHSELDTLGRQAYRVLWDFHPVSGPQSGFHEFDARLGDYSPARVAALKLKVNRFLAQLDGLDTLSLSIDDRIDRYFESYCVSSNEGFDLWNNLRNKFRKNVRFGAGYGIRYR